MTFSPPDLAGRPGDDGAVRSREAVLALGRTAALLSLVLCVLVQLLNHDFFPPDISISQYGIGPRGWVFTAWTAMVALGVLTLYLGGTVRQHHVGSWLAAGSLGVVMMGIVRTDAGGLQQSFHAKVHMVSSIVALVALPIGMALAMANARPKWQRAAWTLVAVSSVSLVMVLISAAGIATPGLDPQHSWAFWQSVAVSADMVLLAGFGLCSVPARQVPARAERASTGER